MPSIVIQNELVRLELLPRGGVHAAQPVVRHARVHHWFMKACEMCAPVSLL